jgi:hypothetical protein
MSQARRRQHICQDRIAAQPDPAAEPQKPNLGDGLGECSGVGLPPGVAEPWLVTGWDEPASLLAVCSLLSVVDRHLTEAGGLQMPQQDCRDPWPLPVTVTPVTAPLAVGLPATAAAQQLEQRQPCAQLDAAFVAACGQILVAAVGQRQPVTVPAGRETQLFACVTKESNAGGEGEHC